MKAKRLDGGYIFHGGCNGCTQPLHVCPSCQYMEADWSLPDMNPVHMEEKKERAGMIKLARRAEKEHNRKASE